MSEQAKKKSTVSRTHPFTQIPDRVLPSTRTPERRTLYRPRSTGREDQTNFHIRKEEKKVIAEDPVQPYAIIDRETALPHPRSHLSSSSFFFFFSSVFYVAENETGCK